MSELEVRRTGLEKEREGLGLVCSRLADYKTSRHKLRVSLLLVGAPQDSSDA